MSPSSRFLLKMLTIEESLKKIGCILASFADFNAHIIKVIENYLSTLA